MHEIVAYGTLVLAVGNKVGEPFKVSAWEYVWRSFRARSENRWDDARRIVEEGLEEQPGSPALTLTLAANESARQWAEGDAELAPLLADL